MTNRESEQRIVPSNPGNSGGFVVGSIAWFATAIASLTRFGLRRRGHRLFGNAISFW